LLDRPEAGERCLLFHVSVGRPSYSDEIEEFRALAESAGAQIVGEVRAQLTRPHPRYFAGPGKVAELAAQVEHRHADVVLVSHALGPNQERNLEQALKARVLDRNGLILDLFAQRAATFEGKLQVELAQLDHLSTRLVRGWSHLERQKGGIGLRGPGETQLETDRRLINQRIKRLRSRLSRVATQREVSRRERMRRQLPTVALVGYTNAGKTTLFNALSGASLEAKDQLFATLDPTVRRLTLDPGEEVLLADTVGFVRDLPHELVAAFRSTLTETREAALLLHVIDASDPHREDRTRQVEDVLREVGASEVPTIKVYNKSDRCDPAELKAGPRGRMFVSARTGEGLGPLIDEIRARLVGWPVVGRIRLRPDQGRIRAQLFRWNAVRGETIDAEGRSTIEVELSARRWRELEQLEGLSAERGSSRPCRRKETEHKGAEHGMG
jgi:GTP-binding protein HflX